MPGRVRRGGGLGMVICLVVGTMGSMAGCAGTDALGGPPPGTVAWYTGYRNVGASGPAPTDPTDPDMALWASSTDLLVRFDSGSMVFDTKRCLIDGQATYKMSKDGTWSFDAGTVAQAKCPGDRAGDDAKVLLDTLAAATRWSFTDKDPNMLGRYYVISDATRSVFLQVPSADFPDPSGSFGSLAPKALPGVTQDPAGLVGSWDVIVLASGGGDVDHGTIAWKVGITPERVVLPKGCNTGTGDGYLAAADGRWFFGADGARTLMLCDAKSEPAQSEAVYDALRNATNWRLGAACPSLQSDAPGRVQVDFTDAAGSTTLRLTRAAGTGETGLPQMTCEH